MPARRLARPRHRGRLARRYAGPAVGQATSPAVSPARLQPGYKPGPKPGHKPGSKPGGELGPALSPATIPATSPVTSLATGPIKSPAETQNPRSPTLKTTETATQSYEIEQLPSPVFQTYGKRVESPGPNFKHSTPGALRGTPGHQEDHYKSNSPSPLGSKPIG